MMSFETLLVIGIILCGGWLTIMALDQISPDAGYVENIGVVFFYVAVFAILWCLIDGASWISGEYLKALGGI